MRLFCKKLIHITLIPIILLVLSYAFWLDGYADPFYLHFASPQQNSLILGTSRSSLAICPFIFKKNGYEDVYNYSFTIAESPWGKDYYNSICRKLDTTKHNGLFIVSVDPFAVSSQINDAGEEVIPHTMLAEIDNVAQSPNWAYIWKYNVQPWKNILYKMKIQTPSFRLHEDGWYENLRGWNIETEKQETDLKIREYKRGFKNNVISRSRLLYLRKTISFLKQYGSVYIVRIPTSPAMYELENQQFPHFDSIIHIIADEYDVRYINCAPQSKEYRTFDGNHLIPDDAKKFTQNLCDSIKAIENNAK